MKKKRIGKAGAAFLLAMLALTFCSRTVYRALMPAVQTARVSGGILSYAAQSGEYLLDATSVRYAYVAAELPQAIRVERVLARANQRVEAGEALVQLYAPEAERALEVARERFAQAEIGWNSWESTYAEAWLELKEQLADSSLSAERQRQLQQRMTLLQQGVVGDTSEQLCRRAYEQARSALDVLESLEAADWTVCAPCSGWVCELFAQPGDGYAGLSPLASIADGAGDMLVGLRWGEAIDLDREAARIRASMSVDGQRVDCQYVKTTTVEGQKVAWMQCAEAVDYGRLTGLSLEAESGFIETLVSADALTGDSVYVLSTRSGAWGETEYYAQAVKLTTGRRSANMVEVKTGLYSGQEIILSANKPLSDGQTVLLQVDYR